jgi:hypothetical protein
LKLKHYYFQIFEDFKPGGSFKRDIFYAEIMDNISIGDDILSYAVFCDDTTLHLYNLHNVRMRGLENIHEKTGQVRASPEMRFGCCS